MPNWLVPTAADASLKVPIVTSSRSRSARSAFSPGMLAHMNLAPAGPEYRAISSMPSAIILVICTAESTFIRSLAVCHQRSLPGMTAPKAVILLRKLLARVPPVVPCG